MKRIEYNLIIVILMSVCLCLLVGYLVILINESFPDNMMARYALNFVVIITSTFLIRFLFKHIRKQSMGE